MMYRGIGLMGHSRYFEVNELRKNGYVHVRNIVPEVLLNAVKSLLENVYKNIQVSAQDNFQDLSFFREDVEKIGEQEVVRRLKTGQFPPSVRSSKDVLALASSDDIMSFLLQVMQSDKLYLHMYPMCRFIESGNMASAVPAHQDFLYNQHMSDFYVVWIPLVEINDTCGGVRFFRYGKKEPYQYYLDGSENKEWESPLNTSGLEYEDIYMTPGDILVFDKYCIHESKPNSSDYLRLSLDLRYFSGRDVSSKHCFSFSDNAVLEGKLNV